jgi:N utilization substance protein B
MLYQCEVGRLDAAEASRLQPLVGAPDAVVELDAESKAFADALASGVWADRQALDTRVGEAARNWRVERMAIIDRLILRLGLHELLAHRGTPPRVVIDEAIELARLYSGDEAARFVNGVLDGIFKRLKDEGLVVE